MDKTTVEPVRQFDRLNLSLVESEIDFGRTVHFTAEIDLTEIERVRARAASALRPTYTAFIAKAVALALAEFPYANRRLFRPLWLPFLSYFQSFRSADVAVAIERNVEGQAAVAYIEVLRDVQRQSLEQITHKLREFANADLTSSRQWRDFSRLATSFPAPLASFIVRLPCHFPKMWQRYRGGAVLISSPSKYGVDGIVAAWTHPLGLSFGLAQKKALVRNDEVVAAMAFTFAMNFDRRVMAGAQAARFFARLCDLLRHPRELTGGAPVPRAQRSEAPA
jgi:pyruvate/2-oxoglutarate dehydrogenase complex dihydrolipoamide acyltransferase (E2) component